MHERRHDPIHDRWVIVAAGRAERPHTFRPPAPLAPSVADCPFCPGNETETPPEVARIGPGAPNTPGWTMRAFPNRYPASDAHEVAVMASAHDRTLTDLDDDEAATFFGLLRDRVRAHRTQGLAYSQVLFNLGEAAGASIEHPHAQVFSIDFVPDPIESLAARSAAAGRSLVAEMRNDEDGEPLALEVGADVVAWCPQASATPYTVMCTPRANGAHFADATDSQVRSTALATRTLLRALDAELGAHAANVTIMSAANGDDRPFQWWMEIQPRLTMVAGFELATNVFVNVMPPESAAARLRRHLEASSGSEK